MLKRFIRFFNKALPRDSLFYIEAQKGDAARDERNFQDGIIAYSKALQIRPDAVAYFVQMGHCLKEVARYEEALNAYDVFHQAHPTDADIHLQIGHVQKLLGDKKAAVIAYTRAHELASPLSQIARDALLELERLAAIRDIPIFDFAVSAMRDRKFEEAYDAFCQSLDARRPTNFGILVAHACKETGRFEEAREWYERHLEYSKQRRLDSIDDWLDAVVQMARFELLEKQHQRAFLLLKEATIALESNDELGDEKYNELWQESRTALNKITKSLLIE